MKNIKIKYLLFLLFLLPTLPQLYKKVISIVEASSTYDVISHPWYLRGHNGSDEEYTKVLGGVHKDKNTLVLTYNLHGACLIGGDASALIFDQPVDGNWHFVSLSNYGKNCFDGTQTVEIKLSDFPGLDLKKRIGKFHVRFWYPQVFQIDILDIKLINAQKAIYTVQANSLNTTTPTIAPTSIPTPVPIVNIAQPQLTSGKSWDIQSVSSMKETKDKICSPNNILYIEKWVDKAKELGANYIAVETPYDNPKCGDAVTLTKTWIDIIRSRGLKVWHRHMFLAFEGIYDTPKNSTNNYLTMTTDYIKAHPDFFAPQDIFTPAPEPQNGGISGFSYCPENVCQFKSISHFNQWLRDAIDQSNIAFNSIGLSNQIKIGYYGFDGFVAWGNNNPDWNGILEDATIQKMGNITIDHYPELIGQTMKQGLDELQLRYPNVPIIIGEWGSVGNTDLIEQVKSSMTAAKRSGVVGFNYWHLGMGGNESLINSDFTNRSHFSMVQDFFKGLN